jgi:hypothetical protein
MKRMGSENMNSKSNIARAKPSGGRRYVMCIDNDGYQASLEVAKVYRILAAGQSAPENWLRVIDESGEDYLYPASRFVPVELPIKGRRALASVG